MGRPLRGRRRSGQQSTCFRRARRPARESYSESRPSLRRSAFSQRLSDPLGQVQTNERSSHRRNAAGDCGGQGADGPRDSLLPAENADGRRSSRLVCAVCGLKRQGAAASSFGWWLVDPPRPRSPRGVAPFGDGLRTAFRVSPPPIGARVPGRVQRGAPQGVCLWRVRERIRPRERRLVAGQMTMNGECAPGHVQRGAPRGRLAWIRADPGRLQPVKHAG